MLLYLPGSATCMTDFSSFTCFYRSVCSFIYLVRQPVRLIFQVLLHFLDVYCFWGGVSYFPEFPKLLISRHVAFVEVRLGGGGRG